MRWSQSHRRRRCRYHHYQTLFSPLSKQPLWPNSSHQPPTQLTSSTSTPPSTKPTTTSPPSSPQPTSPSRRPPPAAVNSLSSATGNDPMDLAGEEENSKATIERVEEQMRGCFIKKKRGRKRQLSPSAAAEERRVNGDGVGGSV
ncbi:hypothetical protein ACLB2K_074136 [Fragaria x ananassa]